MKQVYKTENLEETTARTTYFRGGVLLVGFVVWLMAVTDSFGQNGRANNPGSPNPATSAITITAPGAACQGTQTVLVTYTAGNFNNGGSTTFKAELVAGGVVKGTSGTSGAFSGSLSLPLAGATTGIDYTIRVVSTSSNPNNVKTSNAVGFRLNPLPAATLIGTTTICPNSSAGLTLGLTGTAPWTVVYKANDTQVTLTVTANDSKLDAASGKYTLTVSPAATTAYSLVSVADSTTCSRIISNQQAVVTVEDKTPPVFTSAPLSALSYNTDKGVCSATVAVSELVIPAAADNCGAVTVAHNLEVVNGNVVFPKGASQITWTATDASGNKAHIQQAVHVYDTEIPVFTSVPDAVNINACVAVAKSAVNLGRATATDNCSVAVTNNAPALFPYGLTEVTWTATDESGNAVTAVQKVMISNTLPEVSPVAASAASAKLGSAVALSASFVDADGGAAENFKATWVWAKDAAGNDITTAGTVAKTGSNAYAVTGSYAYQQPGLYAVQLIVADICGQVSATYEYIAIYDLQAGFITGGGWINSAPGSLAKGASATGKASYGFVAKYVKETGLPTGDVDFDFAAGSLSLKSTGIEWLVIAGNKAWIKGSGTINGAGNFNFLLSAVDSELNGHRNLDAFRMQIWNKESGALVYDSQVNAAGNAPAAQVIGGGSIVIHKPKPAARMGAEAPGKAEGALSFGLKAYPNPSASGIFRVSTAEEMTGDALVMVMDTQGQAVYSGVLEAGSRTLEVDLSGKQPGIYLLHIRSSANREVMKLIKP